MIMAILITSAINFIVTLLINFAVWRFQLWRLEKKEKWRKEVVLFLIPVDSGVNDLVLELHLYDF